MFERIFSNVPKIKIQYLDNYDKQNWGFLKYQHQNDAGIDLRAAVSSPIHMNKENVTKLIPTGIKVVIPTGYHIEIRSRSGLALQKQLFVLNSPGTIDSGYRNEIQVILSLFNSSLNSEIKINPGDRIAQMVLIKHSNIIFEEINNIDLFNNTDRNINGFGSTGV